MKMSEDISKIAISMNQFRKAVVQPKKTADNPFFKSKYVNLEGVQEAIDKALPDDLTYSQEAVADEKGVGVATIIMHSSGQYIIYDPLFLPAKKIDAQQFGSAATYARRYTLSSVFGISSDIDDDGNEASGNQRNTNRQNVKPHQSRTPKPNPITSKQKTTLDKLFDSMSKVASTDVKKVKAGYLERSNVSNMNELNNDTANKLIELVTNQLAKKSEEATA